MGIGKLSRRLFLLTFVALIPAAIILFSNLYSIQQTKEEDVRIEALRAGQLASLEMQRIVSGAENVLIALSAASAIQVQDVAGCRAYLARVGTRLPQFSGLAVTNLTGEITCRQTDEGIGASIADRAYFKDAVATGKFVVGAYSLGRISEKPVLPLALPVKNDDGVVVGVVVGGLSLDWLVARLGERDFVKRSALTVADRGGTIIARIPQPEKFVGTKVSARFMKYVNADRPGTSQGVGRDGVERIVGYYPVSSVSAGLFVAVGISTEEAYGAIRRASRISLAATFASLSLSFLLAWLTSSELIRKPVGRLVAAIQDWRQGNEAARTGMSERSGEFGIVGKAIDDFFSELVDVRQKNALAEQQRELLVGELDHRVKNLLATVQSVARQTFRADMRTDDAVAIFTQRLAAMSDAQGLLMKDDWQSAPIRTIVTAAVGPFNNLSSPQFIITGPDFPVRAKAVLSLSMALHELCTNAVKYGALKTGEGRIGIDWLILGDDPQGSEVFRLVWTESGGPPVVVPAKFGFGSKMIERVLGYEFEATVETQYIDTGVICTLVAPANRIRADMDSHSA